METEQSPNKNPLRQSGDPLADEAFTWMQQNGGTASVLDQIVKNSDLVQLSTSTDPLAHLVQSLKLPEWAHIRTISNGSVFFQTYTLDIMAMLGLYALPYCYAGANGARVLYLSKRMREEPETRLKETARFVFEVCEAEAFSNSGHGLVSILKVRLQHAAARYYAQASIEDEVPVNQEDLLGTMLAFSLIVVRGLRKLGIPVSQKDADSYVHLWCVIGFLMGIEAGNLPENLKEASNVERQIRHREFRYSEAGKQLTFSLIEHIKTQSEGFVGISPENLMYYLLGSEVAGYLGIKKSSGFHIAAVEATGRFRNALRLFSEKNYPAVANQFWDKKFQERENLMI